MWGRMSSNIPHRFSPDHLVEKKEINNNIISEGQESLSKGQNLINEGQNLINEGQNLIKDGQKSLKFKRTLLIKRQSLPNIFQNSNNDDILRNKQTNFRCSSSSPQYKMWGQFPVNIEHRFSPDHQTIKNDNDNISNVVDLTNECQIIKKEHELQNDNTNLVSIVGTTVNNDILINDSTINLSSSAIMSSEVCQQSQNLVENENLTDSSVKSQNDIVNTLIKNHYHESISGPIMEKHQYRCCISSDRLNQLRKIVENAIIERKTFTIKGGYNSVRNSLLQRGWIEKIEMRQPSKPGKPCFCSIFSS